MSEHATKAIAPTGGRKRKDPFLSDWDRVHATIASHEAECARIAELTGLQPGGSVLDMACGTGQHLLVFARDGHPCTGSDQLLWKLSLGNRLSRSHELGIRFLCGDMRQLRLAQAYDLVMCFYAMSMMRRDSDLLGALTSGRAALSASGRMVFNVIGSQPGREHEEYQGGHLRTFSKTEIEAFLTRVGLTVVHYEAVAISGLETFDLRFVCQRQEQ